MLRAVILDFGGVLAHDPTAENRAGVAGLCGFADTADFEVAWLRHRGPYDSGELSAAEYWRLVGLEDDGRLGDVLDMDAEGWSRPNGSLAGWLPELRAAGFRTALLSNVPREQWRLLAPFHEDWLRRCDELTLSFEVGAAKPDERIYRVCLERLGVQPEEALFLDDRPDNVTAAAALGLQALRFTDVEALRAELRSRFDGAVPLPVVGADPAA